MPYFGADDVDYEIEYGQTPRTPPTARSAASSGLRSTPRATPRTPRNPGGVISHISRAKSTPQGPQQKTPTIWKASTWEDDYNDPALEEEEQAAEDVHLDFWGQLWSRAGYVPTGDGRYVKTHIPLKSSLPSQRDVQLLAEMEEKRLEEEEERAEAKPTWKNEEGAGRSYSRIAELTRFCELDKLKEMLGVLSRAGTLDRFINFQDSYGWAPMHWAAEYDPEKLSYDQQEKKIDIIRALMEYKATMDLDLTTSRGNTALIHTIWNGNVRACQLLLRKDASDPNAVTESGWTPMHWAANGKRTADNHWSPLPDIVQLLLRRRHEVALDATTNGGDTPLHLAVMRGFKHIIEMLLFAGAPVDRANLNGLTPLHLAALHDYPHIVSFLLQWSARHRTMDRRRRTPAHVYAGSIIHALCLMRFPNLDHEDEFDRMNLDRELADWFAQHGLPETLLSPSVEPDQVLSALQEKEGLQALQAPPHPIREDQAASILEKLSTLRLLRDGIPTDQHRVMESDFFDLDRSRSVAPSRIISPLQTSDFGRTTTHHL